MPLICNTVPFSCAKSSSLFCYIKANSFSTWIMFPMLTRGKEVVIKTFMRTPLNSRDPEGMLLVLVTICQVLVHITSSILIPLVLSFSAGLLSPLLSPQVCAGVPSRYEDRSRFTSFKIGPPGLQGL